MTHDAWRQAQQAQTLMKAHEALSALMPPPDAPAAVRRAYHQRSSEVYAAIAEIDRGHHHEALYWADRERRKALELDQPLTTR